MHVLCNGLRNDLKTLQLQIPNNKIEDRLFVFGSYFFSQVNTYNPRQSDWQKTDNLSLISFPLVKGHLLLITLPVPLLTPKMEKYMYFLGRRKE